MNDTAANADTSTDICYRCGYDLRATPDDRPCPECGLLAARSRRPSDELRHTRPKWLLSLACGAVMIVASMLAAAAWIGGLSALRSSTSLYIRQLPPDFIMELIAWGSAVIACIFFVAVFLLTRREKYPPADRADRWLRRCLRVAALAPLAATVLGICYLELGPPSIYRIWSGQPRGWTFYTPSSTHYYAYSYPYTGPYRAFSLPYRWLDVASFFVATLGSVPLTLLLFLRLRGLAKRARSAHLAEHCVIVGIGAAGALVYYAGFMELYRNTRQWGLGTYWWNRSTVALWLSVLLDTAAILFVAWAIYLLVRFTISFIAAAREIRRLQVETR